MATLGGAAVAATLVALLFLWSRDPDYSVLYAGLSGAQGGRALAELQKLNIPYNISEGGRVILVPTPMLGQARLQLAARGVPKTDSDAWGLLDNEALGVSPFIEQVHYVRGLEANLAHTVGELDGVLSAQVTLAMPKRTGFLADEPKPSASVLLRLAPGARMSSAQVAGVVGLIASSVPGLERDNVTIVDQDGKVLNTQSGDGLQEIPAQLAVVEQFNTRYARLIDDLLTPVVGQGNFRVSVDTDVDFSQSKQSLVKYGQGHVLSEDQTTREGGEGSVPSGIPGALSNRPPDTPTTAPSPNAAANAPAQPNAPTENAKPAGPRESHAITNYDIDKTIQYLQDPPWKLQAISVAVLLNNATATPIPAARLKSIKTLVESVIGAGARHEVTVVDLPFHKLAPTPSLPMTWWKQPWMQLAAQNAALAIAGLLALFGAVFPLLRWLRARPGMTLQPALAAAIAGRVGREGGTAGSQLPGASESSLDFSGVSADAFTVDVDAVRKIVANDPGRTAQVIKEWISRGIPGNQK
jgi:flagellar M-ring protein FliF